MRMFLHVVAAFVILILDWLSGASRSAADPVRAPLVRFVVKHLWLTAGMLAGVLGTASALVVVSGVVPIKASSGHWWITAKILDFAKVRSVAMHSWGIEAPALDDEGLVLRGASHYENGCYPCHGKPGAGLPPVMAAMTPPPPELTGEHLSRWTPEELFSIVKHGIKLTGMPAWPAQQRNDEVWAVVAFLRRMPALDRAEYERLAHGSAVAAAAGPAPHAGHGGPPAPSIVVSTCWRCHGVDGRGRGPGAFPSLAGQHSEYHYGSLRAFADGQRFSGIMTAIAATLSDETMRQVARYYEDLAPRIPETAADPAARARGESLASRGLADLDIPACIECHGPSEVPKNPAYPSLAGQHARYLRLQLELLKQRQRGGSARVNLMHAFVDRLGPAQIRDVTSYYASTPAQFRP